MSEIKENQSKSQKAEVTGFKRAVPIILFAAAAFIALCFITQKTGWLGTFISKFLLGLFSYGAYIIPLLLIIHGVFFFRDLENKCVLSRTIFSCITVITISALSYTIYNFGKDSAFAISEYYRLGTEGKGGGFIGSVLSFALMKIFGSVGMIIIAVAIFALYISFFFAKSKRISGKFLYFLLAVLTSILAFFEKGIKWVIGLFKKAKERKRAEQIQSKNEEFFGDDFFAVDNGLEELKIAELGIKETRSRDSIEANPTLQERVHHKSAVSGADGFGAQYTEKYEAAEAVTDSRKKTVKFYDDKNTIIIENPEEFEKPKQAQQPPKEAQRSAQAERNKMFGLDENAEDVFTSSFDPFDFVSAEALSNKPSSKARTVKNESGIGKLEESISDITEADIKRARDLAFFEERKKASLEHLRKTATPVTSTSDTYIGGSKNVEINVGLEEKVESRATNTPYSVRIDKLEAQMQQSSGFNTQNVNQNIQYNASFESESLEEEDEDIEQAASSDYCDMPDTAAEHEKEEPFAAYGTADLGNNTETTNCEPLVTPRPNYDPIVAERTSGDAFGISEHYEEPEGKAEPESIFAPIDYTDEVAASDSSYDVFKPFTEPSENIIEVNTEVYEKEESFLKTEHSMITPPDGFDDEDEDISIETDYEEEAPAFEGIIPEEERNPEVEKMRKMFPCLDEEPEDEPPFDVQAPAYEAEPAPTVAPTPAPAPAPTPKPQPQKEETKAPDFSNYVMPPIDLLVKDDVSNESAEDEIQENANKLIETLGSFNVTVTIKGYDRGPRITRYEVVPAAGVKVTQVTNLENDVALALAADSLRVEAPIPGKSAIGFEIPNKHSETVRLRELIETDEFARSGKPTTVCIGKDVAGFPVISSIEKMPHVLIAGATGMGKSVCINSLMISMMYKSSPADIRFIMIDPKKVEFTMYNGIPHLLVPIVTDPKQAAGALMWAVEEMERRYDLIGKANVRNIDAYNEKVASNPEIGNKLARIVIVIDEFADLMLQVRDPVENLVMSLAQKARAAGIHLIIGTQKPTTNVITGVIKSNIPTRISCRVSSNVDSRIVLDQSGAEKLLDKGDMLFSMPGMLKPLRAQGAFVSDGEVEEIMDFLKSGTDGPAYDSSVLDQINKAAQRCDKDKNGSSDDYDDDDRSSGDGYLNDRQFLDAVEIAVNMGKISTSLLQRKISIGFGKAAKFIDIMEDLGVVGGHNGQKPRDVLMSADEWHEKLARTQLD